MKKILICMLVSIGLSIGSADTLAHWHGGGWHGGGWNGWNNNGWYGNGWNDNNDWVGAAVGLAAMAVILNQANHYDNYYYRGQPYYYRGYNSRYYRVHCGWVRAHYDYYGYWIPRQRVCWRY